MISLQHIARIVLEPAHLRRTGLLALLVGSWLTAFNLGDLLLLGPFTAALALKILLNYLTPFVVANFGLILRRPDAPPDGPQITPMRRP